MSRRVHCEAHGLWSSYEAGFPLKCPLCECDELRLMIGRLRDNFTRLSGIVGDGLEASRDVAQATSQAVGILAGRESAPIDNTSKGPGLIGDHEYAPCKDTPGDRHFNFPDCDTCHHIVHENPRLQCGQPRKAHLR